MILKYFKEWLSKSIEHRFRFYALTLATVIILIFTTLSYLSLRYILTLNISQNLTHELNLNSKTLNIIFETITGDIDKMSKSSLVLSGLVDSVGRETYLKPFFNDYKNNFNIEVELILVDFMAKPIIANSISSLTEYTENLDITKSLLGTKGVAKIVDNNSKKELLLIKPIIFTRTAHTEGAIVAKISLDSILNVIKKSLHKDYRVELFSQKDIKRDKSFINNRNFLTKEESLILPNPFTPLKFLLKVGISKEKAFTNLYLINIGFAIATIFILTLVFFVTKLMVKTIVTPILKLTKTVKYISDSGELNVKLDVDSKDEIGELSKIFNLMLHKIKESYESKSRHEKLLIQQSKMAEMGEMMGAIAHQWRQPLNTLAIVVQKIKFLYERDKLSEEEIDDIQDKSMKQIHFMSKTIDDFRDFFRPNKDKEEFNINEAIEDVLHILSAQFRVHDISIVIPEVKDVKILGYKNEFKQVLLNILNNSKDAILEKNRKDIHLSGEIIINVFDNEKYINIEIKDNAGGIPLEIIDKIFNPYFTTKGEENGTGVGLYMSKMIIENNMSGHLRVKNIDNGACFTIELAKNDDKGMDE